ncbi:GNAT family N-acetyltransferase [Dokdonia sp. Asnod1-B02]|uniref:GNAT family N-acetyltransferase n=1 Tax=Dokdonia sp. Asnod1-B02 TaxID=3160573 RepID=UPI00386BECDB
MTTLPQQLENPVWYSLRETHKKFAVTFDGVLFYNPAVCTFGAFFDETKTASASREYINTRKDFFFVTENQTPHIDDTKIVLNRKIDGCQMVLKKLSDVVIKEEIILLDESYIDEIYELVWLVMPGFYQKRSFEMGNFYGIIKNGKLVAIAGQRMQTNLFVEISSVVTHPDYTKQKLASQLIAYNAKEILRENKTPILHTNKGNLAIPLYEKLGFEVTRDMNWWLYSRKE